MKRLLVLFVILGTVVAGSGPAAAGRRWTAEAPYSIAAPGGCADAGGQSTCAYYIDCSVSLGCARVILKKPATSVNIEVLDASGAATAARIYAPGAGLIGAICGKSDAPINAYGAGELWVHPHNGTCKDSTPSVATQGIVRVTPASK
ncbi:MAG TPA: hypothetical protein VNC78_03120 [Actinomycetota bacterium]|nr:hypothetical protein [Actinomycetota bacterium]